jgi:hypothetical protein
MRKYTIKSKVKPESININAESHSFTDGVLNLNTKNGNSVFVRIESFSYEEIPETQEEKIVRLEEKIRELEIEKDEANKKSEDRKKALREILAKTHKVSLGKRKAIICEIHKIADTAYWD